MALINCPDCQAPVSSDAMKCPGCGCVLRVHTRGFFGKLFKWMFIGWNVVMVAWLVTGIVAASGLEAHTAAERQGHAIGAAIGISVVMYIWFGGAFWWGILVLLSRPNSSSPSVPVRGQRSSRSTAQSLPTATAVRVESSPASFAPNIGSSPAPMPKRRTSAFVAATLGVVATTVLIVAVATGSKHQDAAGEPTSNRALALQYVLDDFNASMSKGWSWRKPLPDTWAKCARACKKVAAIYKSDEDRCLNFCSSSDNSTQAACFIKASTKADADKCPIFDGVPPKFVVGDQPDVVVMQDYACDSNLLKKIVGGDRGLGQLLAPFHVRQMRCSDGKTTLDITYNK